MSYRRGERTAAQNEREFPNIVELLVPPGGFGPNLDTIYAFHRECGIETRRGRSARRQDTDYVRWCFADCVDAKAFAMAFGGNLSALPPKADSHSRA
jgi:hypothetical protein